MSSVVGPEKTGLRGFSREVDSSETVGYSGKFATKSGLSQLGEPRRLPAIDPLSARSHVIIPTSGNFRRSLAA